tara:strand:- start:8168 stop:8317 length:150 start_codon:yes stop_codon:yes gene_type:complete
MTAQLQVRARFAALHDLWHLPVQDEQNESNFLLNFVLKQIEKKIDPGIL